MEEEKSSHWASIIPEIFYDILARVLPGFVAWCLAVNGYGCFRSWILHVHTVPSLVTTGSSVIIILVFLLACWVTGLLLTPLGDGLWRGERGKRLFLRIVRESGPLMRRAEEKGIFVHQNGPEFWGPNQDTLMLSKVEESASLIYQQLHEYLKDRRVEWRGVLTKNQAEVTFYANAAVTSRLLLVGSIFVVPAACIAMHVPLSRLFSTAGLGFLLSAILPILFVMISTSKGTSAKQERLWTRHLACLTVDLMTEDEHN